MFPVTTDSITNNAQEQPSQSPRYFTTQLTAVPREVSHQSAEESEQAVSMGKDLMPSLHWSIIKCMQIQNSLHKLVLLKLGRKALRSEGHRDTGSYTPETSHAESSDENPDDDPRDLLCELKDPLMGLMGSAQIQRTFFQRLITLNSMITDASADLSNNSSSPGSFILLILISVFSNVRQLAPWTISPRRLAPSLWTISPPSLDD